MIEDRLRKLNRRLRRFGDDDTGNATMLMAFCMPMLIGGAGMAVDFGQFYTWKRELQYANDQAAIAAAWELVENPSSIKYNQRALNAFETNEQVTDSFNTAPVVTLANYAGGVANSVIVTSSASKKLAFTSFFTQAATNVSVSSQAAFKGGATISSCLIAVDEHESSTITIGGNAVFTAQCGIAALSDSSKVCTGYDVAGNCTGYTGADAIDDNGNSYEIKAGSIATAGTISETLKEKALAAGDQIFENAQNLSDPFAGTTPPSAANAPAGAYECKSKGGGNSGGGGNGNGKKGTPTPTPTATATPENLIGTAFPGVYSKGLSVGCDTVFKSGVYFIKGGTLTMNGNHTVTSEGEVMFVLLDGADFKLNGGADINLTGMTEQNLKALGYSDTDAKKLNRMLIYESPNNGKNNGSTFNGNSNTYLNGAIYLKNNQLNLSGTADVSNACLLMVANKVKLTGTLNMSSFCDNSGDQTTTVLYGSVSLVG